MNSEEQRTKMRRNQQDQEYVTPWKPAMVVPEVGEGLPLQEKIQRQKFTPEKQIKKTYTEEIRPDVSASSPLYIGSGGAEEKKDVPEKRYILIMSRFNSWCPLCQNHMTVETRACPGCGVTFTHISTNYTCQWMSQVAQIARPDLIWIPPGELVGIQLFA